MSGIGSAPERRSFRRGRRAALLVRRVDIPGKLKLQPGLGVIAEEARRAHCGIQGDALRPRSSSPTRRRDIPSLCANSGEFPSTARMQLPLYLVMTSSIAASA